ncbi:MAG: prolyl oligopeptidase family serine peptidase [Parachlamydiales bacterium]|jgi:dipeptidyl aminopeptidase/acylaminoacyl peptidase
MKKKKSYGSWPSPITADLIVKDSVRYGNILSDGTNVYFSEMRPLEKGRTTILKIVGDNYEEILPNGFSSRTKVHEYGGLSFYVKNKQVFFSNQEDQRIYKIDQDKKMLPITSSANKRYAEIKYDFSKKILFCIQEEHVKKKVVNSIICIDEDLNVKTIAEGHDFYSSITISDDNKKLAFIAWDMPNMPWDNTSLYIADLKKNGELDNLKKVAGFDNESICLPKWSKDGSLFFVSDKTNFWNLYKYEKDVIENVCKMDCEFARPLWQLGLSMYDFYYEKNKIYILAIYIENGNNRLGLVDVENKTLEKIDNKFTYFSELIVVDDLAYFLAASPLDSISIMCLNIKKKEFRTIKSSRNIKIDPQYISEAISIEFPTENDKTAYMFFYPPKNKDYQSSENEKPPLIVRAHGGPTAQSENFLDLQIQFWTSRGFAFADINYSGSSGFGREYRQRLYGNWGIIDVDDCTNAAIYLSNKGIVDENRLIIRGTSSGGFVTLSALTFKNVFKAGASYYGICDIIALIKDPHKYEAKYEENLIGPYPEKRQLYIERSPINFVENLSCPIILFHGEDDKIVLPEQSKMMFEALKRKKHSDSLSAF